MAPHPWNMPSSYGSPKLPMREGERASSPFKKLRSRLKRKIKSEKTKKASAAKPGAGAKATIEFKAFKP